MQTKTNKNKDLFLNEKEKYKISINTITVCGNIKCIQLYNSNIIEQMQINVILFHLTWFKSVVLMV